MNLEHCHRASCTQIIEGLQVKLSELTAERDALKKDSDRLIWICDKLFESQWNGVVDSGSRTHWRIAGDYRHTVAKMEGFYFRDAIDASMKEKP